MTEQVEIRPQKGAQELALNSEADVVIYGGAAGAGKSHMMLMRPLLQVDDGSFNCVFFRRNGTQLTGGGGLWDEAKLMYYPWRPRVVENTRKITFPSGAKIQFSHMEHVKDRMQHQGLQYSLIVFDEATHFEEEQITYLMSRLRSSAEGDSQMFLSCNPDPDSFLCKWIEWWLDEEGYPDPKKSGIIKYYTLRDGGIKLADTEEELEENFPGCTQVWNKNEEKFEYAPAKTITFIGGTIFDNPALMRANPNYLSELNSLPELEKARLLHGNWYARPEGASYFQRTWLHKATHVPTGAVYCRAWDKAATEPNDTNPSPDYTASVKMSKTRNGDFYITGDYDPTSFDKKDPQVLGRFRERPGSRDLKIEKQSAHDGVDVTVIFSQDPGAAGVTEYTESSKKLIMKGHRVQKDPMPPINSKIARFSPFSSACENGIVYIVESTFTPNTLAAYYAELESFDGERSTANRKDDWPDCSASAFNWLCRKAVLPAFTIADFKRADPFNH